MNGTGEALAEVIRRAREAGVPVVALAGKLDVPPAALRKAGIIGVAFAKSRR